MIVFLRIVFIVTILGGTSMMSTLHKSLTIAFLAVSFFISGLNADLVSAQRSAPNPVVTLTPEEKAWLKKHPRIRLATLTNQPPFSMLDSNGKHTGILADILRILSEAIGQKIEPELVKHATSATHAVAKQDGIYGSASILKTPRHGKEYLLTDAYMDTPFFIFTRVENRNEFRRPSDLKGKRVSIPRNHRAVELFLDQIGDVEKVLADTPLEQMQQVAYNEAAALIGYFTYPHLRNKYLMVDLVIAFIAKSDQGIHIGVNPDQPVLQAIFNKAIAALDDNTINAITAKWTKTSREETPRLELTPDEQAWLKAHPEIALGAPTDYPPMVIKGADGTHVGVLVDLFEQISRRPQCQDSPAHRGFMDRHSGKGAKQGDRRFGLWRKRSEPGRSLQCNRYPDTHLLFCFCTLPTRVSTKALFRPEWHAHRVQKGGAPNKIPAGKASFSHSQAL